MSDVFLSTVELLQS